MLAGGNVKTLTMTVEVHWIRVWTGVRLPAAPLLALKQILKALELFLKINLLEINAMKKIIRWIVCIVVVLAFMCLCFFAGSLYSKKNYDSATISDQLKQISELSTAKLTHNGIVEYSKGSVPLLTEKSFIMSYSADIKAGIDASKVKVKSISKNKIIINIPKATIQETSVDPDSVKILDQNRAIFNWSQHTDIIDALKDAQKDATEAAQSANLTDEADEQVKVIITQFIKNISSLKNKKIYFNYV